MEKQQQKPLFDEEYINKIKEQAMLPEVGLSDYKLCYVTTASDVDFVKRQINHSVKNSKASDRNLNDLVFTKVFNHNGEKYMFYFVKNDILEQDTNTISKIANFNSLIYYNILTGGFGSKRQKTEKILPEYIEMAKRTCFIDANGNIQPLSRIPVASGTIKDGDFNKNTFIECFKTARNKCADSISVSRKTNGNNFEIFLDLSPEFCKYWVNKEIKGSFIGYLDQAINEIRLDLDQIKNACEAYNLLAADGTINGQVTKENHAYISKKNINSYCLIGNPNFAKQTLLDDYEKLFKFGNAYPISDLLFLPSNKVLDILLQVCNDKIENDKKFKTQEEVIEEDFRFFQFLKQTDPKFQKDNRTYSQLEATREQDLYATYVGRMFREGIRYKTEAYAYQKELRDKMNYRDEKHGNKLVEMKNAWDLGYDNEQYKQMKKAFGELGTKIYDRVYYVKFLNYLLETYKPTGALFDLTELSDMFGDPKREAATIECSRRATEQDKEFAKYLMQTTTVDDYISLIQRFDGIIDVQVGKNSNGRFVQSTLSVNPYTKNEIYDKIGDLITPWRMVRNSETNKEKIYVGADPLAFASKQRHEVLNKILQQADRSVTQQDEDCPTSF